MTDTCHWYDKWFWEPLRSLTRALLLCDNCYILIVSKLLWAYCRPCLSLCKHTSFSPRFHFKLGRRWRRVSRELFPPSVDFPMLPWRYQEGGGWEGSTFSSQQMDQMKHGRFRLVGLRLRGAKLLEGLVSFSRYQTLQKSSQSRLAVRSFS